MWLSIAKMAFQTGAHVIKNRQQTKMLVSDAERLHAQKMANGEVEYKKAIMANNNQGWKDEFVLILVSAPVMLLIWSIFSDDPEINIKTIKNDNLSQDSSFNQINTEYETNIDKEAYHVPGKNFTYNDAKAVCKAFNADLATFNDLKNAQQKGASWCSYGWSQDKLALYPTSEENWKKLQKNSDQKYKCGLPGINGSYLDNPYVKLGANCYGVKPYKSKLEADLLKDDYNIPKSHKEVLFNERVKYWKNRLGNVLVYPFNNKNWYMVAKSNEFAEINEINVNDISMNDSVTV